MNRSFAIILVLVAIMAGYSSETRGAPSDTNHAVVTGPVTIEGWYESNGRAHPWQQLCAMTPEATPGTFACEIKVPANSKLEFDVRYASRSQSGYCWAYDFSRNKPCGGNGVSLGQVSATSQGSNVAFEMVSNGAGPKPPIYFNLLVPSTPDDTLSVSVTFR